MTDNTESLILEHLRAIRGKIDVMADDIGNIKMRLSAVESQVANLTAIFNSRLDTLEKRIERIERRLDLSSTPH
jgi:DNA anti-recombination protein RmuC